MTAKATEEKQSPSAAPVSGNPKVQKFKPASASAMEQLQVRTLVFYPKQGESSNFLESLTMCGIKDRDTVQTLREALDRLIVTHYDLILVTFTEDSDVSEQFVDELKNLEATASIPLIAITSDGRPKNVLRIMSKGVDQALVSPFSIRAVREAVEAALWPERAASTAGAVRRAWNILESGAIDKGEHAFEKILEHDSKCVEAKIGLATILLGRERTQDGVKLLKQAMQEAKKLTNVVEQYTLLSRIYHCMGEHFERNNSHDQAIKHYKAALKLNPFGRDTLPELLSVMTAGSTVEDILTFLDQVKGDFAPFSAPLDHIAEGLESLLKRYRALNIQESIDKVFLYLAKLDHTNSELHLRTVDYLLATGQGRCAARNLLERITQGIRDTDLMSRLAGFYVEAARSKPEPLVGDENDLACFADQTPEQLIRTAYDWYNESLLIEPFEPAIWLNLVRCHVWLKAPQRAEDTLQRMVESLDISADLLADIGDTLINELAYELAESYVQQGVEEYPKDSRFHLLQARLYNVQKEHFKAVAALKRGLSENPDSVDCMKELGKTYGELDKWSDAIEFYERASQKRPDDVDIQQGLQAALARKYKK